ncbi:MAG: hypothetical protein BWY74_00051 [Firmicutes bacterium ADurb.Bin419]|nr:MAG: hypothetical protein BWY74_00051 [Firmicutes bacterium ADurb.Bin419]
MRLFTIGFTKKSAKEFFTILKNRGVKKLIDIRLNNTSQLAGFSKGEDLKFFLEEFCEISYYHDLNFAPTKEILDNYKNKKITWKDYEELYNSILAKRNINKWLEEHYKLNFEGICFLCSEEKADKCHRRLAAEYIAKNYPDLKIEIVHL